MQGFVIVAFRISLIPPAEEYLRGGGASHTLAVDWGGQHWDLLQITFPYSLITEYAGIESEISFIFRFAGENRYQNTIGAAYGARTVRSVVQTYGNLILIFCN